MHLRLRCVLVCRFFFIFQIGEQIAEHRWLREMRFISLFHFHSYSSQQNKKKKKKERERCQMCVLACCCEGNFGMNVDTLAFRTPL